jgi:prephenate dehydrogenase
MFIQRLSIIGVGLIGGSLARALRGVCDEIVGCGRNRSNLQKAVELGVIDSYETVPAKAVNQADMVIIAVPLGSMAAMFAAIRDALSPDAVISDVGSAKASVVEDARQYLGEHFRHFVPAHPIAGTEKSGVVASFAELFEKRRVIITPLSDTDSAAYAKVCAMWEQTGADVVDMSVEHHDKVLAATSHLPHLLAYSLVDTLAKMETSTEIFGFAAGGFRDFTRIASSNPRMWRDICLANQKAILEMLGHFNDNLAELTDAVRSGDAERIETIFGRAKAARDNFCEDKIF